MAEKCVMCDVGYPNSLNPHLCKRCYLVADYDFSARRNWWGGFFTGMLIMACVAAFAVRLVR